MMAFLRWIIVFLSFTLEVHVSAAGVPPSIEAERGEDADFVFEPYDCHQRISNRCLLMSLQNGARFKHRGIELVFTKGTVLSIRPGNELTLIEGLVWVRSSEEFTLKSLHGELKGNDFDGLVSISKGQYWHIRHLKGAPVHIVPQGYMKSLVLVQGYENKVGFVDMTGKAEVEIPQVIPVRSLIKDMALLVLEGKGKIKELISHYYVLWEGSVDQSGARYKKMILRRIASIKAEKLRRLELARIREAENKALRDLFRRRNYFYFEN